MEQERYEIHIKGHLSTNWSDWFDGSGPSSVKSRRVNQYQVYYTIALFS
jgi:hypothetical protein